jgi:hypothetical protein
MQIVPAEQVIRKKQDIPEHDECGLCSRRAWGKCAGVADNLCGMAINPYTGERLEKRKVERSKGYIPHQPAEFCLCGCGQRIVQNKQGTRLYVDKAHRGLSKKERYMASEAYTSKWGKHDL